MPTFSSVIDAAVRPALESVSKRYGSGRVAVEALDLEVDEGEVCVLVGPSGCGKTTTLKMVNRLIEPTGGRILLGGEDVTHVDPVALRRRIGYVIQNVGLFPHQDVAGNVATVPRLLGWDRSRVNRRVDELLELVGLDPAEFGKRYPHQLSGGQRQRVGVARALGGDPPVLLMDEPFGAIDPVTRERLQGEFRRLQAVVAKTVVFVTHDVDEATRVGDRIAVLGDHGRLQQHDTPAAVLGRPASPFVAEFVGADRGLKRLAVIPLAGVKLDPPETGDVRAERAETGHFRAQPAETGDVWAERAERAVPSVPLAASLQDALSAMLAAGTTRVKVVDGDQTCGTLGLHALHAAARDWE